MPPKIRCESDNCNRKLGLTGLTCKCGKMFCTTHILCESHNCCFDHKVDGKEQLRKKLDVGQLVDKVIKI